MQAVISLIVYGRIASCDGLIALVTVSVCILTGIIVIVAGPNL